METIGNLAFAFLAPLLAIALLALILGLLGSREQRRGRAALLPMAFVYLALVAIGVYVLFVGPCPECPPDVGKRLMRQYDLNELQLEMAAKRHRDLDPKLAKLNYDIRTAGTALEDYARKIALERLVHGNWCYYSEYKGVDESLDKAFRGDLAIERDPVAQGLSLMGSYGTVTFRARRLLMDGEGITFDWISSDTSMTGSAGSPVTANGQTFLTFKAEDPETHLKLRMEGFYTVLMENGLMARGDMWLVRRDQVIEPGSTQEIQRDCDKILAQAGIGVESVSTGSPPADR